LIANTIQYQNEKFLLADYGLFLDPVFLTALGVARMKEMQLHLYLPAMDVVCAVAIGEKIKNPIRKATDTEGANTVILICLCCFTTPFVFFLFHALK